MSEDPSVVNLSEIDVIDWLQRRMFVMGPHQGINTGIDQRVRAEMITGGLPAAIAAEAINEMQDSGIFFTYSSSDGHVTENTLFTVKTALSAVGATTTQANNAITNVQNHGIFFRQVSPT